MRVILHGAKEEFHLLDTVGRPQSQRRMFFWSRKTRPYAASLDYFQRNSKSSMMHTISPSKHSKEEELDQLDAHFSQVEPSSFGDLTTQIMEETDALDHLGSVDPRRMPTSSARGRISLACWLKTDTHIQNHTVKFEIAREARTCSYLDAGAVGNLNGLAEATHEKKTGMRTQPRLVVATTGSWLPSVISHSWVTAARLFHRFSEADP